MTASASGDGDQAKLWARAIRHVFGVDNASGPSRDAARAGLEELLAEVDRLREERRLLLVEYALWISPVWEEDNSDDRDAAEDVVDEFLRLKEEGGD